MLQAVHANPARTQILICLSNPDMVAAINEILTKCGFAVTTTYEFGQFVEASTLGHYKVVVTAAAMIERIREVSTLPILNIEAFIFEESDDAVPTRGKRCPISKIFAQHVIALTEGAESLPYNYALKFSPEMELIQR